MARGPDHVSIATNPSGADVFVDNLQVGRTPIEIDLDRARERVEIKLELPSFAPITILRIRHTNYWIYGNLLIGGLPGIIIDVWAKNAQRFDDDPIAVGFTPEAPGSTALPAPAVFRPATPPKPELPFSGFR